MRLFQAALDTPLDSALLRHPLSSRFALHGFRALSEYCFACGSRTRSHLRGSRNRTRNQSKPYSRPAETVLGNSRNRTRSVRGQRHVSFPSLWGSQEKFFGNWHISVFKPFFFLRRNFTRLRWEAGGTLFREYCLEKRTH